MESVIAFLLILKHLYSTEIFNIPGDTKVSMQSKEIWLGLEWPNFVVGK